METDEIRAFSLRQYIWDLQVLFRAEQQSCTRGDEVTVKIECGFPFTQMSRLALRQCKEVALGTSMETGTCPDLGSVITGSFCC